MATTYTNGGLDVGLNADRAFFHRTFEQLRAAFARHKVYRSTVNELSALSDRSLGDLGIARGAIKRVARETAYD
tara:strand:+ start:1430 stop:1651 length:222 start_codon:yes stop_codon:yes gene_type:complete